jgi:hypothetical protein
MEIIIDFDAIKDSAKRDWLLHTLKLMRIGFQTSEKPQTLEAYNKDLDEGVSEFLRGEFLTTEDLRKQAEKW